MTENLSGFRVLPQGAEIESKMELRNQRPGILCTPFIAMYRALSSPQWESFRESTHLFKMRCEDVPGIGSAITLYPGHFRLMFQDVPPLLKVTLRILARCSPPQIPVERFEYPGSYSSRLVPQLAFEHRPSV
jgi:hypothetical protein